MGDQFFKKLPALDAFVDVTDSENYHPVPGDWTIVITDIKGSTEAIERGRYKDVNVVGAASIISAINAADGVDFPYVFGGDGSTLVVPESIRLPVLATLRGLAEISKSGFDLTLRVGAVPVSLVTSQGHDVLVAKHAVSESMRLAMFWGTGLTEAERLIKTTEEFLVEVDGTTPDIEGLQCRWEPFKSRHGTIASVLVTATSTDTLTHGSVYREVIEFIENLTEDSKPVHNKNARVAIDRSTLSSETRLKSGVKSGLKYNLRWGMTALATFVGRTAIHNEFALGPMSAGYKDAVLKNTDFRKFDETLRMVLDLSEENLTNLRDFLETLRKKGLVSFGIHASSAALMTCVVFDYDKNHLHFVDGSDGGYAAAAKELKRQIKENQ